MVAWIFPVGDSGNSAKGFSSPEQCPFLFCSDTSGHHVDHAGNKVGDNSVEMGIPFFTGLLLFLGLANLPIAGAAVFQKVGGVFALLSAVILWKMAWKAIQDMTHEMMQGN